jgi:hypothetical protein
MTPEELIEMIEQMSPDDQARVAAFYNIPGYGDVPGDEFDDDYYEAQMTDDDVNDLLADFRVRNMGVARNIRPESWQRAGEILHQNPDASVEAAMEAALGEAEAAAEEDELGEHLDHFERRAGRELLPEEVAGLEQAYDRDAIDEFSPLDLNDSTQRGEYLDRKLSGDYDGVAQDLDDNRNEYGHIEADLNDPQGRANAIDALMSGEQVYDTTPESEED